MIIHKGLKVRLLFSIYFLLLVLSFLLPVTASPLHRFTAFALDVPPLRGYVNDYANMMSAQTKENLEAELRAFEQSDSTQLVVLTVPSLQGEVLEEFSVKVAEAWKIGQKGKDNGIIFLVASQERKIRIEVGRGLEGRLTDLTAGRVIDLVIVPRFKRNDYNGGFTAGVHALVDASRGEFKAEGKGATSRKKQGSPLPAILIFSAIALNVLSRFSRFLGGAAGALGLPFIAYFVLGLPVITVILLGILGLLLGILLPTIFSGRHSGGSFYSGGSWGSGGTGGGISSGGGFSGGGASGSW
ncbi:MAG TPA: TPM domain-containing protein [Syntrophorhabdaceae bacterium]|nr:TPM domain-containing protein [Syntrophorhabdaceae bacterium]HQM80296.1 TPM domain-containing protein [Syntrophorhabdaceae bacterium]